MSKRFVDEKRFPRNRENINRQKNNFGKVIKIMKRTLLFSILLLVLAVQVSYAGDNTFPASGNVGIGTDNPNTKLHIEKGPDGGFIHINYPSHTAYGEIGIVSHNEGGAIGHVSTMWAGSNLYDWNGMDYPSGRTYHPIQHKSPK